MHRAVLAVSAAAAGVATVRLAAWLDERIALLLDEGWRAALRLPGRWRAPGPEDGLGAVLAVAAALVLEPSDAVPAALALEGCLAVCAWIDWRHRIIPDVVCLPLLAGGLAVSATPAALVDWSVAWPGALFGLALGGAVRCCGGRLGWGDVKLLGAVGGWVGPLAICLLFLLSCGLMAIPLAWRRRTAGEAGLPMAPFLAVATLPVVLAQATSTAKDIYLLNKIYSIIFLTCYP